MRSRLGTGFEPAADGRLRLLMVGAALVFGLFVLRLFQLQVVMGDTLRMRSERNSIRTLRIEAPRGDILDRYGRVLATTRPAFDLEAIPHDLVSPDVTFRTLGALLEQDPDVLRTRFGEPRGRARFQPVRLAADMPYERLARVESHRYALPGLVTEVRPVRQYPGGDLASHLLGTIGEIRASQLSTRAFAGYRAGEVVGQSGLEATLEAHLRGRAGGRNVVVDVKGQEMELLEEVDPVPGGSAVLTLDLDLQREAVLAFQRDGPGESARAGALVALDPRNGDVLALVSRPAYDPNHFATGIASEEWEQLTSDADEPLMDRALSGQYPPGSTYKPILAAAALQEGVIEPGTRYFCPGSFRLGRRTYRCWRRGGHGWLDVHEALVRSCDVFFYQVGLKLGVDRLAFFARAFQLGRPTGIGLPQEKPGLVPTSAWKAARFGEPWVGGETVSASIGQGFNLATPLQVAVAFAAIANGGVPVRPRLVLRLEDRDGALVAESQPELRGRLPVDSDVLARVRDALVGAVGEAGGTGRLARVEGVRVAGKTGTAQVVSLRHTEGLDPEEIMRRHRDHAWFVGFAPAEDPEIVVAVLVEHGGGGGTEAAPIAQRILAKALRGAAGDPGVVARSTTPGPEPAELRGGADRAAR